MYQTKSCLVLVINSNVPIRKKLRISEQISSLNLNSRALNKPKTRFLLYWILQQYTAVPPDSTLLQTFFFLIIHSLAL